MRIQIIKTYKDMQLNRIVEASEVIEVSQERGLELCNLGIAVQMDSEPTPEQSQVDLSPPLKAETTHTEEKEDVWTVQFKKPLEAGSLLLKTSSEKDARLRFEIEDIKDIDGRLELFKNMEFVESREYVPPAKSKKTTKKRKSKIIKRRKK